MIDIKENYKMNSGVARICEKTGIMIVSIRLTMFAENLHYLGLCHHLFKKILLHSQMKRTFDVIILRNYYS